MNLRPTKPGAPSGETSTRIRELADILLAGGRAHCDVRIPRTEIAGRMRLLSRAEISEVKTSIVKYFTDAGMPSTPTALAAAGLLEEWNLELAVRHLAIAVRDPKDESLQLAIVDDWRECEDDQIAALWKQYADHEDSLDPMAAHIALSEKDREEIERLAKKGEASLLMPFGSLRLATYLTTSAAPPAS